MTTRFTVQHTFDIDEDTYWPKVFFDDAYNLGLYNEALQFKSFEQLEKTDTGGGAIVRRLKMEPKVEMPAVLKKVLGDSFTYSELGKFDPKTRKWHYEVTPSRMADKIFIRGDFWVEKRGDKKIERFCSVEVEAKIFGVGGTLESQIEKQTRDSYERAAAFTQKWIREKGL